MSLAVVRSLERHLDLAVVPATGGRGQGVVPHYTLHHGDSSGVRTVVPLEGLWDDNFYFLFPPNSTWGPALIPYYTFQCPPTRPWVGPLPSKLVYISESYLHRYGRFCSVRSHCIVSEQVDIPCSCTVVVMLASNPLTHM